MTYIRDAQKVKDMSLFSLQIDDLLGEKRYTCVCRKQPPVLDRVCLKVMYRQDGSWWFHRIHWHVAQVTTAQIKVPGSDQEGQLLAKGAHRNEHRFEGEGQ